MGWVGGGWAAAWLWPFEVAKPREKARQNHRLAAEMCFFALKAVVVHAHTFNAKPTCVCPLNVSVNCSVPWSVPRTTPILPWQQTPLAPAMMSLSRGNDDVAIYEEPEDLLVMNDTLSISDEQPVEEDGSIDSDKQLIEDQHDSDEEQIEAMYSSPAADADTNTDEDEDACSEPPCSLCPVRMTPKNCQREILHRQDEESRRDCFRVAFAVYIYWWLGNIRKSSYKNNLRARVSRRGRELRRLSRW